MFITLCLHKNSFATLVLRHMTPELRCTTYVYACVITADSRLSLILLLQPCKPRPITDGSFTKANMISYHSYVQACVTAVHIHAR